MSSSPTANFSGVSGSILFSIDNARQFFCREFDGSTAFFFLGGFKSHLQLVARGQRRRDEADFFDAQHAAEGYEAILHSCLGSPNQIPLGRVACQTET